jgi:ABC-type uncharacterized transport system auxiliary subunit
MARKLFCLATLILITSGCSSPSPAAPTTSPPVSQPAAQFASISGQVYANVSWGDPPIPDANVTVTESDGSIKRVTSDENGFYLIFVRAGDVSITASKDGYEARTWQLTLLRDLVLNFGLMPR